MLPNLQETANLVTFAEEIFNEKFRLLCSFLYSFNLGPMSRGIFSIIYNTAWKREYSGYTQQTTTCSKSTKETLEKGVKHVENWQ